jgi:tetratricopeptide (TPR) repeat protein
VLKAMHTELARRYQSVQQFSEDIRRYLEGLPIAAQPDTLAYRASKFVRRHRLGVAAAVTLFASLVGGIGISMLEARRADTEAATAKPVNEFLQNDLLAQAGASAQSGPNTKPDPHLEVRTALDRAEARVGAKFAKQPLVEAAIRQTISRAFLDLGLFMDAQHQAERALDLRRRALGAEHPDVLRSMTALAAVYFFQGKFAQAEPLLTTALAVGRRVLGRNHRDTLAIIRDLGNLYTFEGDDARAEPLLAEALEAHQRVLGPEDPDTLQTMDALGAVYRTVGKYAQAEMVLSQALEIRKRVSGVEHPDTLDTAYELGIVYVRQGKYAPAEALLSSVAASYRRIFGEQHQSTLLALAGLVNLYTVEKRYAEGEALASRLLDLRRRALGPESPDALNAMNALAELYRRQVKYEQAEILFANALESRRRVLGTQHRDTAGTLKSLGLVRVQRRNYAGAEPPLREALSVYEKLNSGIWGQYDTETILGASLAGQGKYAEGEPLLLSGYQSLVERQNRIPTDYPAVFDAGERIIRLYTDWGKPDEASAWRDKLHTPKTASAAPTANR